MSNIDVKFKKLDNFKEFPKYATTNAAAMDVYSTIDTVIPANSIGKIPLGFALSIPDGYEIIVCPRSGMFVNSFIDVAGTIDSDYRGELFVMMHNHATDPFIIECGDRIAQIKLRGVLKIVFDEVDCLDDTARGTGGFGHTGR